MTKQNKGRKLFATTATAALVASAIVPVASASGLNDFNSIPTWAQDSVQYLVDSGAIAGDQNGNFNPQKSLTRAQAAVILSNVLGLEATGTENFKDVKEGQWFYDAVVATSPEIFTGDEKGNFNPSKSLTRQEAAKVLVDAFGLEGTADLSDFSDASKVPAWSKSYLETAVANGVIAGKGSLLAPTLSISNAEFATMTVRALDAAGLITEQPVAVKSVKAINATTVEVTFEEAVEDVKAFDFEIEGLKVENAAVKQTDDKVVVLTTSKQDGAKEYTLTNAGDKLGSFKGISAVVPTAVTIEKSSNSLKVGTEYTVKANIGVKEAGVAVTFNIDAPAGSLNKDYIVEAYTNAEGIATYSYTQYAAGVDTVSVYPTGAPTVRAIANVYWGVQDILTIVPTATETTINNGTVKTYKVKFVNPTTGVPISNANLNVLFDENISQVNGSSATATNVNTGVALTPAQRPTGNANALTLTTNSNGEAQFTVTGSNTVATPVVYADVQNLPNGIGGNGNTRLDATELQAVAPKVTFQGAQTTHTITITPDTDATVAASTTRGRVYTVEVKKADGKAFAGGLVNIGLNEILDADITTNTNALITWTDADNSLRTTPVELPNTGVTARNANQVLALALNNDGKATFMVSNGTVGQTATPVVWIDQDTPNNAGQTNGQIDSTEPKAIGSKSIFENRTISKVALEVSNSTQISGQGTTFTATVQDQNSAAFVNGERTRLTFTFTNTGSNTATISAPTAAFEANSFSIAGSADGAWANYTVNPGQSVTIAGTLAAGQTAGALTVTGNGSTDVNASVEARTLTSNTYASTSTATTAKFVNAVLADNYPIIGGGVGQNFTGNVVAFTKADGDYDNGIVNDYGWVIIELDNLPGTFVRAPYKAGDLFTLAPNTTNWVGAAPISVDTFESVLTLGDKVSLTNGGVNAQSTFSVFNADTSVGGTITGNFAANVAGTVATAFQAATPAAAGVYTSASLPATLPTGTSIDLTVGATTNAGIALDGLTPAQAVTTINTLFGATVASTVNNGSQIQFTSATATDSITVANSTNTALFANATAANTLATGATAAVWNFALVGTPNIVAGQTVTVNGIVFTAGTANNAATRTFDSTGLAGLADDVTAIATVYNLVDTTTLQAGAAATTLTLTQRTAGTGLPAGNVTVK
ncbi:S-layer homology domain-containing protein [Lysinibacillus sp. BW-2-10]|uniref:S-layer homology domain-containing protein n=1 Tax=Lysinibacillus sp. BW-2-10 TaxID=2590030 RepID=UPI00117EFFEB|nr:S-layer homology domain-containing protein [Lysinibacillus sp. BW-2-10]TSI07374.1 S-layer homology domain-containing protein [Lysinibacillus sp. BW-2-10]